MKFSFNEPEQVVVLKTDKASAIRTSDMDAEVRYNFDPDVDGTVYIETDKWFKIKDLREFADMLNFFADELEKKEYLE